MAQGVSTGVRSIIDSFANGLDILCKLRAKSKRRRRNQTQEYAEDESVELSRSLLQSPYDISLEYQRGMQGHGEQYARGDTIAQTRLAEILLKLNSGLVGIIASFLDRDQRKKVSVDYGGLTKLSESSRKDSLEVLRHLYQRMASRRSPNMRTIPKNDKPKKPAGDKSASHSRIRGPTIARVMIEDSQKRPQLAVVKPVAKRKSSSSSNLTKVPSYSSSTTAVDSVQSTRRKTPRVRTSTPALKQDTSILNSRSPEVLQRHERPLAARSMPGLIPSYTDTERAPAMPQHLVDQVPALPVYRPRKDTPTMYSIATDSTKLGEIPLHKWAVPYDFEAMSMLNREAMQSGWPLVDLDGSAVFKPKKRCGFWGMFRRKETQRTV